MSIPGYCSANTGRTNTADTRCACAGLWVFQASGAASSYRGTCWTVAHVQLWWFVTFLNLSPTTFHIVLKCHRWCHADHSNCYFWWGSKRLCQTTWNIKKYLVNFVHPETVWSLIISSFQVYPIFLTELNNLFRFQFKISYKEIFSYASSSTLYPCERVSDS